jgi:Tfp pilus assembly PilM family ATPase/Tfp pilus assembly protein PilN
MPKNVLGIEYGLQHVTLVQVTGTPKAYSVTATIQEAWPQATEPAERQTLHQQFLQELLQVHHLQADTIVTTLPAHGAVLRNLTSPFKEPRSIRPTIKYDLEDHMPFDPEDVVVDFQVLSLQSPGATRLLVAAVPHQVLASHLALFQGAGVEPTMVDLDVFALANAVLFGTAALPTNAALIDITPARMLLTLLHRGTPVFARSMPQNGAISDVATLANRLSKHVQHTLYACEHALQQAYEPDILLIGGAEGLQLGPLSHAMSQEMGLPTEVWHITADSHKAGKTSFPPRLHSQYAVAFGAAMRGLHRQSVGVNLRRDSFALHRDLQELRGRLIGVGIMLVCVAGLGLLSLYLNNAYKTTRHAQLRSEIGRVFQETLPGVRIAQPTFQMREKMRELEERLRAFGGVTGAQLSGLQLLREISARVPASITVNVDTLTITKDTTELSGTTTSYDDVVKLKDALEASPYFTMVKINNTKADVDNKIAFKLTITTVKGLETSS